MNAAIAEHKEPYKSLAITPSILANGLESRGNELKLVDIDGLIAGHSDAFNIFCCDGSDACPAVAVAVVFAVVGAGLQCSVSQDMRYAVCQDIRYTPRSGFAMLAGLVGSPEGDRRALPTSRDITSARVRPCFRSISRTYMCR